ncbi:MAG: 6-carboxytetrahydropterin synthase QueD [Saprospiraceae bacterium]|nr:6-carboxytetrahydropterin synthase QueD [Saprospiraceae bacterium]
MIIFKHFNFDSAHFLPLVPDGHKCKGIHGHTYRMTLEFEGEIDAEMGWLIDFAEIKKTVNPLIEAVDHKLLNDIEGLENPTCEMIAKWFWDKISPQLPQLSKVILNETTTSGVIYNGPHK